MNRWKSHPMWHQWGNLTAYHSALDVACDWYSAIWTIVPIRELDKTTVKRKRLEKNTGEFRKLLDDRLPLANLVYLSSFALFEGFCSDAFTALATAKKIDKCEDYLTGGVECWSDRLLGHVNRKWSSVKCGREGILEAALFRNCLAHGANVYSAKDVKRYTDLKMSPPIVAGQRIPTDELDVFEMRKRLNYYLTILQQGLTKVVP